MNHPLGTVLVTGAGGGLGKVIAAALERRGYTVLGTSRQPSADKGSLLQLDLRSDESVASLLEEVQRRTGRIDALVNNAGYRFHGAVEETSVDEARAQLETNFLGLHRLTRAVLPMMRAQGGGKIVNIGSLAGISGPPFGAVYAASKAAVAAYTESLWHEVHPLGISVSLVTPGPMRSEARPMPQGPEKPIAVYDEGRARAVSAIRAGEQSGKLHGDQVADCVVRVLASSSPRLHYRVGSEAKWLPALKSALPWATYAKGVRRKFRLD